MKDVLRILVFALAAWASQSASAQGWGGWNKLEMCQGCHDIGMRGGMGMGMNPGETAPKLGGQHAAYLEKSLRAYRSGERRHPVMNHMASMLGDREIAEIADFYARRDDK